MQRAEKQAYRVNLAALHAICEANYARLLKLFPDYETRNSHEFDVGGARVRIDVVERSRYTTIFRLFQTQGEAGWLGLLRVEVRAYHDAAMLEVGAFQSHRRVQGRYSYPNARMYQQDEKRQQNHFLADWLEHCLENGRSTTPLPAPGN